MCIRDRTSLAQPEKVVGFQGDAAAPSAVLLKNNGLHFEIQIDPASSIGRTDAAGVKDVLMLSLIHISSGLPLSRAFNLLSRSWRDSAGWVSE